MRVIFALFALLLCAAHISATCIDENGKRVDWFIIIKGGYIAASPHPHTKVGMAYTYLDSNNKQFQLSRKALTDASSALGRTLQQFYNNSPARAGYVLYNDHTPDDATSSSFGHAKGTVWFNSTEGFWLVHSTPRFPLTKAQTSSYVYPEYAKLYGQSFLCLSMSLDQIDQVGRQLSYMNPQIYEKNIPASLYSRVPTLAAVVEGTNIIKRDPASNILQIETRGKQKFTSFAKNKPWNKDLYTHLVIPHIKDGMFIETWMRPFEPSCCPGASGCGLGSINVMTVRLDPNSSNIDYRYTKDHAKWGISMSGKNGRWTCIGDINRNLSQYKRGGGTVCIDNQEVWNAFKDLILELDTC